MTSTFSLAVLADGQEAYHKVSLRTGKSKPLAARPPWVREPMGQEGGAAVSDGRTVLSQGGDLYLIHPDGSEQRLTRDEAVERNPHRSPDLSKVAYTKQHDLYVYDLDQMKEVRLTTDGSETIYNGWASWVYYEEILGRSSQYAAFWWSPDGEHIAYLQFDDEPVPLFPIFRSAGQHGDLEVMRYPKAGDRPPHAKFGVVSLRTQATTWIEEDSDKDQFSAWPFWTPDGEHLLFQELNRGQDTLHLVKANPRTGQREVIYTEIQPTWVEFYEEIDFLPDNSFLMRSNRDGWYNLYHHDINGHLINQLTDFDWRVTSIDRIDIQNEQLFFYATGADRSARHYYRVNLDGSQLKQLTSASGWHTVQLSPNGTYVYDEYSSLLDPGGAQITSVKDGRRVWTQQALPEDDNADAGVRVEQLSIKTPDGFELPGYWVLPKGFDQDSKYPVVFTIYGGPDAGTVRNSYSNYSNDFYANNGIIRLVVDHRASGKFGKRGMDHMHRNLGKWEVDDLITAVKWLRELPYIDAERIGITGGSYGGYVTCMALTYGSDYFTHGISLYPVTDWKLYDNIYTERYMDTPAENPEGYAFGSAATHAERFEGKLLIVHGMMDDNVHMQNTMQFVSKMQDLGKQFEMMMYPGERHGWGGPKRAHLTDLTQDFWHRHFVGAMGQKVMRP